MTVLVRDSLTAIVGNHSPIHEVATMSKKFTFTAGLIAVVVVIAIFVGVKLLGGPSYEEQLVGDWYETPDSSYSLFTLYSDGTCSILGEYGMGQWSLVNDNQLKITTIFGQAINFFDGSNTPMTIVSLKDGCLTLESPDQSMQVELYNLS